MAAKETVKKKPAAIQVSGKAMTPKCETNSKDKHCLDETITSNAGAWSSEPTSPTEPNAVEQMMNINRRLVAQIETLRLKVEVDARHHEKAKNNLQSSNTSKLKTRELEIENLKSDLKQKEVTMKNLSEENQSKSSKIQQLQQYIAELKDDVKMSKSYADEIQAQLDQLHSAKLSLESGSAYSKKDNQIQTLQKEVDTLRTHLQTLERELSMAKEKIAQQGGRLRLAEIDRGNTQVKFKEELARVTQTMRNEIERMRDVMRQQWEEMRELREQNEDMRNDIREIRELLVADQETNQNRAYGHVYSPFNLKALSPTLPGLKKDTNRIVHGKKKM